MKKPLPEKLKALREQAGLSRGQLADAAGIDRAYYGRLEIGKIASPSWPVICELARVLKVSLDDLK